MQTLEHLSAEKEVAFWGSSSQRVLMFPYQTLICSVRVCVHKVWSEIIGNFNVMAYLPRSGQTIIWTGLFSAVLHVE